MHSLATFVLRLQGMSEYRSRCFWLAGLDQKLCGIVGTGEHVILVLYNQRVMLSASQLYHLCTQDMKECSGEPRVSMALCFSSLRGFLLLVKNPILSGRYRDPGSIYVRPEKDVAVPCASDKSTVQRWHVRFVLGRIGSPLQESGNGKLPCTVFKGTGQWEDSTPEISSRVGYMCI
jgi:hypothetical protein